VKSIVVIAGKMKSNVETDGIANTIQAFLKSEASQHESETVGFFAK
jgi:hypothetical protein